MEPETLKVKYLRGHLRDVNAASTCSHLAPTLKIDVQLVPISEGASILTVPGQAGKSLKFARQVVERPQLGFYCLSPQLLAALTENMVEDVKEQIPTNGLVTTLEYCRICPFWQASAGGK